MDADDFRCRPEPKAICQAWLDRSSVALMDGDVDTVVSMTSFPFTLRTSECEGVVEYAEDLRGDVAAVAGALKGQNVTNFIRLVESAQYLDKDTIEARHTTYTLRDATTLSPPYGSRIVLRRIGEDWKNIEADHEISGARFPLALLRSDPGSLAGLWRNSTRGQIANHVQAEPIYQVFTDSLSDASQSDDFAAWTEHFTLPCSIHYDDADHIARTADHMLTVFQMIKLQLKGSGADRIDRQACCAVFLPGSRILGYHDTISSKGNEPVFGPIKSRMMLTFVEGRWRCSSVTKSLSNDDMAPIQCEISGTLPTMREIQERMRK